MPLRSRPIGAVPAIHTKRHRYSLVRALQMAADETTLDGIEGEASREIERRTGKRPKGFWLPMGNEPELRGLLKHSERRDLTTTTGSGAVFTSADLPFVEVLRKRMVLKTLGATHLTGLKGRLAIPRQSASTTAYWVAEGVAVTPSNPTLDQVQLADKTLGGATVIDRKLLFQSSIDAESMVKDDLAKVVALELDRAGINGSGGAQPIGVLQDSAVQAGSAGLAMGPNGGVPTFSKMVAMESALAAANADVVDLKYLTTPGLRGTLKTTTKTPDQPYFVAQDDEVNGYPLVASGQVPSNLTKGTASGVCHAIIFANWADLVVAQWGGIDVQTNPYELQLSGSIIVSILTEVDIAIRHPESFKIITDALTG